jgi:hypothetical protein
MCGQLSLAQVNYSILDQNPFSVRHRQIQLQRFPVQIIYPEGLDSLAQVTANQLDRSLSAVGLGLSASLHPWKIVLQNQGMVSNGFVSLAAPRAEYFMLPPQDPSLLGTNDWISLLAAHESRHMFQNEIGRTGLAKWMYYLWGNNGQMAYTNLLIPNWLWEGDAVETETRVTGFGRSVIPQFQMPLRAYLDTFGAPSYAKLMGRSFREYVPNHYVFGQKFSHLLQQRYGQDVIGRIWQQTLNTPIPFSFSRSVKKITGKSVDNFAKEILSTTSVIKKIKLKQKGFTNYFYPNPVNDKLEYTPAIPCLYDSGVLKNASVKKMSSSSGITFKSSVQEENSIVIPKNAINFALKFFILIILKFNIYTQQKLFLSWINSVINSSKYFRI